MKYRITTIVAVFTITAIGLGLRLYQLGHDSFWIDEVGVAVAVSADTIPEMLEHKHRHVMSMPLDYVVLWLVARLGVSEFLLRLPAAFWGALSLPVLFLLLSRLKNTQVALLATFLLALSPIHIQYSQEARFYASLVFFYLVSHLLLYKALMNPTIKAWAVFTIVCILGLYFHIYVILSLITGFFAVWFTKSTSKTGALNRIFFTSSSIAVVISFLVAVLTFGTVYSYDIPLLIDNYSVISTIAIGVGWLPFFYSQSWAPYILGILCLLFAVLGVSQSLHRPGSWDSNLIVSSVMQIKAIIAMNILRNYFIAPRQFIILLPLLLYFTALGVTQATQFLAKTISIQLSTLKIRANSHHLLAMSNLSLVILLGLASLPALHNYYLSDKGQAREISHYLQEVWQPGDIVLVIPDFELQYQYYLAKEDPEDPILAAIYGTDWQRLAQDSEYSNITYLIAPYHLTSEQQEVLGALSYQLVRPSGAISPYARQVWIRER